MSEHQERHCAAFWVSEDTILELLCTAQNIPHRVLLATIQNVPVDAKIQRVHHDWMHRAFWFLLSHPSFPIWENGAEAPRLGEIEYSLVELACRDITPSPDVVVETTP